MARRPIAGVVTDGQGNIISGAIVALTVYSGAVATAYDLQSGGSTFSGGLTTSNTDGSYEFWIDDSDHAVITVFNVTATKDGYETRVTPVAA